MNNKAVPLEILSSKDRILFITHLAIGDFTYMQNYFFSFAKQYPNLKIDLLIDPERGRSLLRRWTSNKNYILQDWIKGCGLFENVYIVPSSWWKYFDFVRKLKQHKYELIVCLSSINIFKFLNLAKKISKKAFLVSVLPKIKKYQFIKKYKFKKVKSFVLKDKIISKLNYHATDEYAYWFEALFDVFVEKEKRYPFISIPRAWICSSKLKFLKWGINEKERKKLKIIFLNTFAKTYKRSWPIERVFELINSLKGKDDFFSTAFVVNVMPNVYKKLENSFNNYSKQNVFFFTVTHNFFQLPAMISLSDLVISVETSVIHLAAALNRPVIALMRQKNPEWEPLIDKKEIVYTKNRKDWIKEISVESVIEKFRKIYF